MTKWIAAFSLMLGLGATACAVDDGDANDGDDQEEDEGTTVPAGDEETRPDEIFDGKEDSGSGSGSAGCSARTTKREVNCKERDARRAAPPEGGAKVNAPQRK